MQRVSTKKTKNFRELAEGNLSKSRELARRNPKPPASQPHQHLRRPREGRGRTSSTFEEALGDRRRALNIKGKISSRKSNSKKSSSRKSSRTTSINI